MENTSKNNLIESKTKVLLSLAIPKNKSTEWKDCINESINKYILSLSSVDEPVILDRPLRSRESIVRDLENRVNNMKVSFNCCN